MKQKRFTSIILILVIALSMLIVPSKPLTVYAGQDIDQMGEWELKQIDALYNYLSGQGFCLEAIAGIIGNADCESGLTEANGKNTSHMYFGDLWFCSANGNYAIPNWYKEKGYEIGDITGEISFIVESEHNFGVNCKQYCKSEFASMDVLKTANGKTGEDGAKFVAELFAVGWENCYGGSDKQEYGTSKRTSELYQGLEKRKKWAVQAYNYLKDQGKTPGVTVKELTSDLLKEKIGSVALYQHQLGYPAGCDGMSMAMVVQNSTLLKEYQLPAGVYNDKNNAEWKKFKGVAEGVLFQSGGTAIQPNDFLGKYGKSTFNDLKSINITDKHEQGAWKGAFAIDGTSKKKFIEMTHEEFAEVVKQLQAQGYFMILSVRYKKHNTGGWGVYNVSGKSYTDDATYFVPYGGSDYNPNYFTGTDKTLKGNHWTYLLGCASDGKVYINDPATYSDNAQCIALIDKRNGVTYTSGDSIDYVPSYILCFESTTVNTKKLLGDATVPVNPDVADDIGIDPDDPVNVIQIGDLKYYKETDLTSYNKLDELNISDMYLQDALLENLGQSDVYALDNWKSVADEDKWTVTRVFRLIITLIGILLTVWAIFLYLAYWLDRINNIIDIRFVSFLTLGKMEVSEDELGASYGEVKKERGKVTTINHKAVLKICITTLVLGVLLLTGALYKFVLGVIQWVSSIFTN